MVAARGIWLLSCIVALSAHVASQSSCKPSVHGPACTVDSNCTSVPNCLRCAHSGYCTSTPLPGPSPPGPPGPSPPPSPGPDSPYGKPGDYDLLLFARFWMGEPADEIKCGTYAANGLTLHGIWPQYNAARDGHEYPQFCNDTFGSVVPSVSTAFADQWSKYAPAYPAGTTHTYSDLAAHEWKKHGTCWSGDLSKIAPGDTKSLAQLQTRFFQNSLDLNTKYPVPKGKTTVPLADLQNAFGGPTKVLLKCTGTQLFMVSLCLHVSGTQTACPQDTLADPYTNNCVTDNVADVGVFFQCSDTMMESIRLNL